MFDVSSRYYALETKLLTMKDGSVVAYKSRRFLPLLDLNKPVAEITFIDGDRLDLITARALGDPLQFWKIADVNHEMYPQSLTKQAGAKIRVPTTPF